VAADHDAAAMVNAAADTIDPFFNLRILPNIQCGRQKKGGDSRPRPLGNR
jgi:hypothetical protein